MMGAFETLTAAREATPQARSAARRKAILSCSIGNFLELFDFVVFGFFAATIGRNFFPSTDPTISLLSSFATYGVGFVMRPSILRNAEKLWRKSEELVGESFPAP